MAAFIQPWKQLLFTHVSFVLQLCDWDICGSLYSALGYFALCPVFPLQFTQDFVRRGQLCHVENEEGQSGFPGAPSARSHRPASPTRPQGLFGGFSVLPKTLGAPPALFPGPTHSVIGKACCESLVNFVLMWLQV